MRRSCARRPSEGCSTMGVHLHWERLRAPPGVACRPLLQDSARHIAISGLQTAGGRAPSHRAASAGVRRSAGTPRFARGKPRLTAGPAPVRVPVSAPQQRVPSAVRKTKEAPATHCENRITSRHHVNAFCLARIEMSLKTYESIFQKRCRIHPKPNICSVRVGAPPGPLRAPGGRRTRRRKLRRAGFGGLAHVGARGAQLGTFWLR